MLDQNKQTPMQEFIDIIKKRQEGDEAIPSMYNDEIIELAESLLEKEKEVMCGIYDDAVAAFDPFYIGQEKFGEQYYNETFNTKENGTQTRRRTHTLRK